MKTFLLSAAIRCWFSACSSPGLNNAPDKYVSLFSVDSGRPAGLVLTVYSTTLLANGEDQTRIRVYAIDSLGREISSAQMPLQFFVRGDATLISPDNGGSPLEFSGSGDSAVWKSAMKDGSCRLIFRSGGRPDKIRLQVRADNLWPASHEIHTIPATTALLTPTPGQLAYKGRRGSRIIGADVSFLPQIEARGMKFLENGTEADPLLVLQQNGHNYIRLRLFVDPAHERGYSPYQGFCGLEKTLEMARRVKQAGMQILLNFHYSDTWADPQKQFKPHAWDSLDFASLKDSVRLYTRNVLLAFKAQGTLPGMVQVGNEINHGMLWPDGHISNPDQLAQLLIAGLQGVKEADSSILTMQHVALGGQKQESQFWFDNMIARGVEFDIIGLSFYPQYHGTLDDLAANARFLSERYQKDVNVVEYAMYHKELSEILFTLPDGRGQGHFSWELLGRFFNLRSGEPADLLKEYSELHRMYIEE
ncbi:MAG: glycosyl hydrolase 53 family protein [Bacteroidales bacterium]